MPEITMTAVAAILALSVVLNILLAFRLRHQERELQSNQEKLQQLATTVNGICSAAVGVDKRIIRLEQKGRDLEHRQESMETQKQSERPYGEAIQLVHRGATVSKLVEELGLSHSEAELVVMLHGMQKAG